MPALEQGRLAALNAARYRKQNISQELRKGLFANAAKQGKEETDEEQQQSPYKSRLAMLKAGAIKEANRQGGAAAGATVGGTLGSVVPVIGTGVGAFIGRYIGRKLGITGIVIVSIIMMLLSFLIFIAVIKYGCNKIYGAQWLITGARDICAALGE